MLKKKTLHILLFLFLLFVPLVLSAAQIDPTGKNITAETLDEAKKQTQADIQAQQDASAAAAAAATATTVAGITTAALATGVLAATGVGLAILGVAALGAAIWSYFTADSGTFVYILEAFRSYEDGCWFCPVVRALFNAINTFSVTIAEGLRDSFIMLLELGFLFYILIKVGQSFLTFGSINPKEFLKELFYPFIKVLVVVIFLYNMASFYRYAINPVAQLSIGFALDIEKTASQTGLEKLSYIKNGEVVEGCGFDIVYTDENKIGYSSAVVDSIQCFLKTQASALMLYMAIGATFIADSWKSGNFHVFPNLTMFFIGVIMFISTFILFLAFPLKLLDSIIRLMFFSALLPLWLVLWIFPVTRDKSKAAFNMFLHVLVTFICLSIILVMILIILRTALDFQTQDEFDRFLQKLISGDTAGALKQMDWNGRKLFIFVSMMLLANSLAKSVDSFVSQFAGGGVDVGAGAAFATTGLGLAQAAARITKTPVKKATEATGKAIGTGIRDTGEALKEGIKKTPYAAGYAVGATAKAARKFFNPAGEIMKNANKNIASSLAETTRLKNAALGAATAKGTQRMTKTSSRVSLPDGKIKDKNQSTFTTADGRKLQENTHETILDGTKEVSKVSKREKFDPTTGKSLGSLSIERDIATGSRTVIERDADGNITKQYTVAGKKTTP